MPFVTDIVGPQRPVQAWPPLVIGALRRTSTIDTHPAGAGHSDVDLRARDVVGRGPGGLDVLGQVGVRAHLADRVIDDIASDPPTARLAQLSGSRVGPGFRSTVGKLFPDEVATGQPAAPAARRLGRRGAGLRLRGAARGDHPGHRGEAARRHRRHTWRASARASPQDASLVPYARRNGTIPSVHGPVAPPLDRRDGMHAVEPLRAHGMRRFRRLDLGRRDGRRLRRALPRLARRRRRRRDDRARVHGRRLGRRVDANDHARSPRPCGCCRGRSAPAPSEVPRESAGMTLSELRDRIRGEFVGTSTCTHLNDTLRAIADLDALLDLRAGALGLDDV